MNEWHAQIQFAGRRGRVGLGASNKEAAARMAASIAAECGTSVLSCNPDAKAETATRTEFNAMSHQEKLNFAKRGGQLQDSIV